MKPQYILFLLFAFFITGLSDGISWALIALPGIGVILDFVIEMSINATMGAGLIMLLMLNGMYHPTWGPFTIVGGLLPGLNILPFWAALVAMGIVHDMSKEGKKDGKRGMFGAAGSALKAVTALEEGRVMSAASNATHAVRAAHTINNDITARAANDNFSYVQTAA